MNYIFSLISLLALLLNTTVALATPLNTTATAFHRVTPIGFLGTPPNGTTPWSKGYDINQGGEVVGVSSTNLGFGYGVSRAFLWLPLSAHGLSAGMHMLGTPSGNLDYTEAYDLNNLGQVVGIETTGFANDQKAVLWLPSAAYGFSAGAIGLHTILNTAAYPEVLVRSIPTEINDSGQVIGYADAYSGQRYGFKWDPTSGTTFSTYKPLAINNFGEILWNYGPALSLCLPAANHGLPAGCSNISMPATLDSYGIEVPTLTDTGKIYSYAVASDNRRHGYMWENGTVSDLGTAPTGNGFLLLSGNSRGIAVGHDSLNSMTDRGYIYVPGAGLTLLDNLQAPGETWRLTRGIDLNSQGKVLADGYIPGSPSQAVVIKIR